MSEGAKWKNNLLSSSVPMEFEVAKLLVKHGFSTEADYSYKRHDAATTNDFSVDLHATAYLPFNNPDKITATLQLLVECKHRHRKNKWLFFPDPNLGDFSSVTLGHTLRVVDDFSPVILSHQYSTSFDTKSTFCLKGIEIDQGNDNVYDKEIKRGLLQLQYALPRLLSDSIEWSFSRSDINWPFMYCPILLTTSEIYVASPETTIEKVEQAESLDDFATLAPWVVVFCEQTHEFQRHRAETCSDLEPLLESEELTLMDNIRRQGGIEDIFLPSAKCIELLEGYSWGLLNKYFSQVIVCSLSQFEPLLNELKRVAVETEKDRRELETHQL
ncbi:hypothetical protein [Paraburkholderia sacchari]|uniref:hypothetical protein n=1 Tax=Paraburkholderia sacchari TaxID=159450 RepID=UPI000543B365|nr:hypothetical protein [Paraburkholderia sacchari]NLP63471.1 hypothetical protein [Paraburkholderia sacchari]